MQRQPKLVPSIVRPREPLIVDYDWETREYWLAVKDTRERIAGPFPSSFDALDFAATGLGRSDGHHR
jgi:hypothetical protein